MRTLLKIAKAAKNALIIHPKMLRERCVKCGNELKVPTIAALGFAFLVVANPSAAQQVAACPAAPDFSRYGAEREAIEYARAMGQAVNAREEAASLDRAADLAMLLLPDARAGAACQAGQPAPEPACHAEDRRALAVYLASAIPAEQIRDVWSFLLPRAGPIPPADPAQPLAGWRFTRLSASGALTYNLVTAPPHIDNRRERAWQYLSNHRSGEAVMSAVSQFVQSRAGRDCR